MAAGALAGIGEHVLMFPVDTIKTRMQALAHPGQQVRWRARVAALFTAPPPSSHLTAAPLPPPPQLHTSLGRALSAVLRREGVPGLYRGVSAMALGAGCAAAAAASRRRLSKPFRAK